MVTTLKELNDSEEMHLSGFIENLKTHEMEMKVCEGREPTKKSITFKATPSIVEYDESLEEGEKDFAMLIRKIEKTSERYKRCSTKEEDNATIEELDHRESLKE